MELNRLRYTSISLKRQRAGLATGSARQQLPASFGPTLAHPSRRFSRYYPVRLTQLSDVRSDSRRVVSVGSFSATTPAIRPSTCDSHRIDFTLTFLSRKCKFLSAFPGKLRIDGGEYKVVVADLHDEFTVGQGDKSLQVGDVIQRQLPYRRVVVANVRGHWWYAACNHGFPYPL